MTYSFFCKRTTTAIRRIRTIEYTINSSSPIENSPPMFCVMLSHLMPFSCSTIYGNPWQIIKIDTSTNSMPEIVRYTMIILLIFEICLGALALQSCDENDTMTPPNSSSIRTHTMKSNKKELSPKQREELLSALKARFGKNLNRHQGLDWAKVQARLDADAEKLWSLQEMERTGGEPDVVGQDKKSGEYVFCDCSPETPKNRVSVCYDREGLESRKEHRPKTTAMDMAAAMGVELLTEEEYFDLQKLGEFDTKTSSWVKTPAGIRKLGGALYADRRYGRIFVGHNGAQSYYSSRGFRASLRV